MKFRLFREYGARNSPPIFDAFEQGVKKIGMNLSNDNDAIPVIWSVLWHGRMLPNKTIYQRCKINNLPVIIIEVGNLKRGSTWRISLNHVNNLGNFGLGDLDYDRPKKLGINLKSQTKNNESILIACQHQFSEQWPTNKSVSEWVIETVRSARKYTDRKIIVRPHPRFSISLIQNDFVIEKPIKVPSTYDDYNINYDYHCVINHNAGPGVQSLIHGTPVICDESSLAYPLSNKIEFIESLKLPEREKWLIDITHKEWTVSEIAQGLPLIRLMRSLS